MVEWIVINANPRTWGQISTLGCVLSPLLLTSEQHTELETRNLNTHIPMHSQSWTEIELLSWPESHREIVSCPLSLMTVSWCFCMWCVIYRAVCHVTALFLARKAQNRALYLLKAAVYPSILSTEMTVVFWRTSCGRDNLDDEISVCLSVCNDTVCLFRKVVIYVQAQRLRVFYLKCTSNWCHEIAF